MTLAFDNGERNTLDGGGGEDTLNGGGDRFVYGAIGDSAFGTTTRDTITDFAVTGSLRDLIDLPAVDAIESTPGIDDAFAFIGTAGFNAEGQIRVSQSGLNAIIHINTSGTRDSEMQIVLKDSTATDLTAADFVL